MARMHNVEGWHYGIRSLFQCHHPTLWILIKWIKKHRKKQKAAFLQTVTGIENSSKKVTPTAQTNFCMMTLLLWGILGYYLESMAKRVLELALTILRWWHSTISCQLRRMSSSTDQMVEGYPDTASSKICEGPLSVALRVVSLIAVITPLLLCHLVHELQTQCCFSCGGKSVSWAPHVCKSSPVVTYSYLNTIRLLISFLFLKT